MVKLDRVFVSSIVGATYGKLLGDNDDAIFGAMYGALVGIVAELVNDMKILARR